MEKQELEDFVEQSKSLLEQSPQMDEQNTKRKLIEPFLKVLGWNILSPEVELEYSVKIGTSTNKVDYALLIEDSPMVLVEAKGVDTSLNQDDQEQLKSYIRQTGVDIGLLTNGREFEIFKRQTDSNRPEESSLGSLSLENLLEDISILKTLTRDLIESGEAQKIAHRIEEDRRSAQILRANKKNLAERITDLIIDEIRESNSQTVEDGAKQFIDVLAKSLEQQAEGKLSINPTKDTSIPNKSTSKWEPKKGANAVEGVVSKENIEGDQNSLVALFPSKKSGVQFLKENNAWGFVRIGKNPDFVAIYVSEDIQQIKYIARVKKIVNPAEADLARPIEHYNESGSVEEQANFDVDKQVIVFEPGTLFELEDPIELGSKWPQGLTYTKLHKVKGASKTHEVF